MPKTTEIEFMCESTQSYSTHESKIRVVVEISKDDLSNLINNIPTKDLSNYLPDSFFEEWASDNGYVKEQEQNH